MSTPSPSPGRGRWWKRGLLFVLTLVVGLLLAEFAFRLWLSAHSESFDSAATRLEIERLESTARDSVPRVVSDIPWNQTTERAQGRVVHPYWAWENVGGLELLNGEASRIGKPEFDGDLEILVVGGSVAEMFTQFGEKELEQRLAADPKLAGRRIHFYACARGGFKQPQQIDLVNDLLGLGFTPEVVLNIDGFNEVALANTNARHGVNPTYPSLAHWGLLATGGVVDREAIDLAADGRVRQREILALADRARSWGLWRSALASRFVMKRMNQLRAEVQTAFDAYTNRIKGEFTDLVLHGPPFDSAPDAVMHAAVKMWSESSRTLRAMCDARGITYVHVLQPTLHDTPNRTPTKKELRVGGAPEEWIEGIHLGYPLLRAAGAELARGGEHFVDGSPLFKDVTDTVYIDNCHFLDAGNALLAAAAAKAILEALPAR